MSTKKVSADYTFYPTGDTQLSVFLFQNALDRVGKWQMTQPNKDGCTRIAGESKYGTHRIILEIKVSKIDNQTAATVYGTTTSQDNSPAVKCIGRLIQVFEILDKNNIEEVVNLLMTRERKLKTGFTLAGLILYVITGIDIAQRRKIF